MFDNLKDPTILPLLNQVSDAIGGAVAIGAATDGRSVTDIAYRNMVLRRTEKSATTLSRQRGVSGEKRMVTLAESLLRQAHYRYACSIEQTRDSGRKNLREADELNLNQ